MDESWDIRKPPMTNGMQNHMRNLAILQVCMSDAAR